jgi:hypothetical protein
MIRLNLIDAAKRHIFVGMFLKRQPDHVLSSLKIRKSPSMRSPKGSLLKDVGATVRQ